MRALALVALILVAAPVFAQPPTVAAPPSCEAILRAEGLLSPNQTCEQALRAALSLVGHLQRQRQAEEHDNAFAHSQKDAALKRLQSEVARLKGELEKAKKPEKAE